MSKTPLRVAMAQLDNRVGDIESNTRQIINAAKIARDRDHADLVVTPELALIGYPPDDLLLRHELPRAIEAALTHLVTALFDVTVIVGYPEYCGDTIYNAAAIIRDGKQIANYRKQCLPNYGVFDEYRHFRAGSMPCVFEQNNYQVGVTICEDLWENEPAKRAKSAGAEILLSLNASPFHTGKQSEREKLLTRCAQTHDLTIYYTNSVGGQDELAFDGHSCVANPQGEITARAPAFEAGVYCFEHPYAITRDPLTAPRDPRAEVYDALVVAIRDYVDRNGFSGVLIGSSGGIDSALTLALATDALGRDRVWAVSLPSRYTAEISNIDAAEQAKRLGIRYDELPIESLFSLSLETLAPLFDARTPDTTEENLQARIRGMLLMSLSNKFGYIVLATGNKSEMAVGYATLYGDMCGGFAPLKDVYKTEVYQLAQYRNTQGEVVPQRIITRPPSAELRPDQADTDSLPEYETLDAIIAAYVEDNASIKEICAQGYKESTVQQVVNLIRRNEYKRYQAAPGPKITRCAFGRNRRYPITATYGDM